SIFRDGDWLALFDGSNRIVAHGIFEAAGAIAIRILRRGPARPDAAWLRAQLADAVARHAALALSGAPAADAAGVAAAGVAHTLVRPAHRRLASAAAPALRV